MNRFRPIALTVVALSLVAFIPTQAIAVGGSGVPAQGQSQ